MSIISPKQNYYTKALIKEKSDGYMMQFSINGEIKSMCNMSTTQKFPLKKDSFEIKYHTHDTAEQIMYEKFRKEISTMVNKDYFFTFSVHQKLFIFPRSLGCFFDEGIYRTTKEEKFIIWLFDSHTLFMQSVLHFYNKRVTLFSAICSKTWINKEGFQNCESQVLYQDSDLS